MEKQNKNTDKLTDKAFSRLIITSVLGILVCIMCLCSATWAWFSADVSSANNTLSSGKFDLSVAIVDENEAPVTVSAMDNGAYSCVLSEAGLYTVTLKITDDTTATKGFCTVKVGENTYRTDSIRAEGEKTFIFKIKTPEPNLTLTFIPAWGVPADASVGHGGTLSIEAPVISGN